MIAANNDRLVVRVPEAATSGLVRLTTPGGTVTSPVKFSLLVDRVGRLVAPPGATAADYVVVNEFLEETVPAADGGFRQPADAAGLTTHLGVPQDGSDRVLLDLDIFNPEEGTGAIAKLAADSTALDLESTARTLVFLSPYLATAHPRQARVTMEYIRQDAQVAAFVRVLGQLYEQTSSPFADARFAPAYRAAIASVLEGMPEELTTDLRSPLPEPPSRPAPKPLRVLEVDPDGEAWANEHLLQIFPDIHITHPGSVSAPGQLEPEGVVGNPIDWVVELGEIDDPERTFPHGLTDIRRLEGSYTVFPRTGYESLAFIESDSYMAYIDWFGVLVNYAWDGVTGAIADVLPGLKGVASPDNRLHIPDRDGVYVVRAYSGVLRDLYSENEVIDRIPDGFKKFQLAFAFNATMVGIDVASIFLGDVQAQVGPGKWKVVMRKGLRNGLRKGIRLGAKRLPRGALSVTQSSVSEGTKIFLDVMNNILADVVGVILGELPDPISMNFKGGVKSTLKALGSAIDVFFKASKAGAAYERTMVMVSGYRPGYWISPLETWILVVGDPFNPRITSLSKTQGGTGSTLTIKGERFGPIAEMNQVYFGTVPARILAASATELKVEVPAMHKGATNFSANRDELRVHLEYMVDAQRVARTLNPAVLEWQSYGRLRFHAPADVLAGARVSVWVETPAGKTGKRTYVQQEGLAVEATTQLPRGYTLKVNSAATGIDADGELTLDEAVAILNGRINPNLPPWAPVHEDHTGRDRPYEQYQVSGTQGGAGYRDEIRLDMATERPHLRMSAAGMVGGEARDPQGFLFAGDLIHLGRASLYLERPLKMRDGSTLVAGEIAGQGVVVGGCKSVVSGISYAPVRFSDIVGTAVTVEGRTDSIDGANEIYVAVDGVDGDGIVVSHSHLNRIQGWVRDCGGSGIVVEDGEENELGSYVGSAGRLRVTGCDEDGIRVRGGKANTMYTRVDSNGGDGIRLEGTHANSIVADSVRYNSGVGLRLNGASGNSIDGPLSLVGNAAEGVWLDGAAAANDLTLRQVSGSRVGVRLSGAGTQGNEVDAWRISAQAREGVRLESGANNNTVRTIIDSNGADGLLISGRGTADNIIHSQRIAANTGHGVHLAQGAAGNTVFAADIRHNDGHGVLVEGGGTDNNRIENLGGGGQMRISTNGGAGVRVIGQGTSAPCGLRVRMYAVSDNQDAGVWITSVGGTAGTCGVHLSVASVERSPVGLWLDGGTRGVQMEATDGNGLLEITDCPIGIMMEGAQTADNSLEAWMRISGSTAAPVHLTDGTHGNVLDHVEVKDAVARGVLIDAGARANELYRPHISNTQGDGVVIDAAHDNLLVDPVLVDNAGDGLVVRHGACGTEVRGTEGEISGNMVDGIWVTGPGTRGLVVRADQISGNGLSGVLIQGQVTDVEIGDPIGGPIPCAATMHLEDNGQHAVWITDGANDVTVHGCRIKRAQYQADTYGIRVDDGAQQVRIGTASLPGGNKADGGISSTGHTAEVLVRGTDTRQVWIVNGDFGSWPSSKYGIRVEDGATGVRIGGGALEENVLMVAEEAGIYVSGADTRVDIVGNNVWSNQKAGIHLSGGATGARIRDNVIQGGPVHGLLLDGGAHANEIFSNIIKANRGSGVALAGGAHDNIVRANRIFTNTVGISVSGANATANTLRGNAISVSMRQPIDLRDGGNWEIPAPTIDDLSLDKGYVRGFVDPQVPDGSIVDVHADRFGEGKFFVGSTQVVNGRFRLDKTLPTGLGFRALVTDLRGNTSEFGGYGAQIQAPGRLTDVLFTADWDGNEEIYRLAGGAGAGTRLTREEGADHTPRLSPSGRYITCTVGAVVVWIAAP